MCKAVVRRRSHLDSSIHCTIVSGHRDAVLSSVEGRSHGYTDRGYRALKHKSNSYSTDSHTYIAQDTVGAWSVCAWGWARERRLVGRSAQSGRECESGVLQAETNAYPLAEGRGLNAALGGALNNVALSSTCPCSYSAPGIFARGTDNLTYGSTALGCKCATRGTPTRPASSL